MMVVTDLDGTLAEKDLDISARDIATLEALGKKRITRVVATGRSAYGARKILSAAFPIDYLIFSSGAGILDWRSSELLRSRNFSDGEIAGTARKLIERGLDFMIHDPIPENHTFVHYSSGNANLDFVQRCERHPGMCAPWDGVSPISSASQFLIIDGRHDSRKLYEELVAMFPAMSLIRATSPIDHRSAWIEIFAPSVAKSLAAAWVGERVGASPKNVLAVGNDFNDLDLLHWAGTPFVVANAPADLRAVFPSVAECRGSGFSEAVERWLASQQAEDRNSDSVPR
jgi:hydroxymethylpyrimidine pyrophosphatase-like HAD family hydrolase